MCVRVCVCVCVHARSCTCSLTVSQTRLQARYDVVIVDQVAVVIPFLKYLTSSKVLFYCHFPDMLLVQRRSCIRKLYRYVLVVRPVPEHH